MDTKFTENVHDVVGCTTGCTWPSPKAAGPAKAIAGANKESRGNNDGDTPETTSAVDINTDGTLQPEAKVGKPILTVPLAMEGDVGCAEGSSASSEAPSMSQMVN